jgi:hypothetical protein
MFKEIGQLASMMRNLPKIREEVGQLQERLARIIVEGDAGAGLVKTKVNGKLELIACTISEDALKLNDREMLEDLIKNAVNQAIQKTRELVAEETGKMASNLGLPPGMNLPGLT